MSTGSGAPAIAPGAVDGTEQAVCHCPHPRDGRSPSRLPALSPERLARARPLPAVQTGSGRLTPTPLTQSTSLQLFLQHGDCQLSPDK